MAWQDPHGPDWRDAYGQYGQDPYSQQYGEPQDSPPPGYAQDPYSQGSYGQGSYGQGAYGQDPYGQASYAQDPYGQYSYGPPGVGSRTGNPGFAIAALVANIVSAVLCCGIGLAWIPGIILAAVAMSRNATDPESARKLTIGAWVCFVIDVVLTVVGLILLGVYSDSHPTTTY
jgi:uncharacterized membrane protein YqaE (UPF0057 family)